MENKTKKAFILLLGLVTVLGLFFSTAYADQFMDTYDKARELYKQKKYKIAAPLFKGLAEKYPNHNFAPNALYWLAECYYDQGDYKQAQVYLKKAARDYPKSYKAPDAELKLAYIQSRLGDKAQAISTLEKLIKNHPRAFSIKKARQRLADWKEDQGSKPEPLKQKLKVKPKAKPKKKVIARKPVRQEPVKPKPVKKAPAKKAAPAVKKQVLKKRQERPKAVPKPLERKPAPIIKKKSVELPEDRVARVLGLNKPEPKAVKKQPSIKPSPRKKLTLAKTADYTQVFRAIKDNDQAGLKKLVTANAFVVALKDSEGYTPLHLAARHNRTKMIEYLLARDSDINSDSGGYIYKFTPLHAAVKAGSLDAARTLIKHKANIDSGKYLRRKEWINRYTLTPLFQAVGLNQIAMVKLLLKAGADPNISAHPSIGETPLRLAKKNGNPEIAALLRKYGAIH